MSPQACNRLAYDRCSNCVWPASVLFSKLLAPCVCVFLPTACLCLPDTGVYDMLDWLLPFTWFLMKCCCLAQRVASGLTALPLVLLLVWR